METSPLASSIVTVVRQDVPKGIIAGKWREVVRIPDVTSCTGTHGVWVENWSSEPVKLHRSAISVEIQPVYQMPRYTNEDLDDQEDQEEVRAHTTRVVEATPQPTECPPEFKHPWTAL